MPVADASLIRKKLRPGILRVVEHKGYELHQRLLRGVSSGVGLADRGTGVAGSATEKAEQVRLENKTENQKKNRTTNANVDSAEPEAAATATFVTAIFTIQPKREVSLAHR